MGIDRRACAGFSSRKQSRDVWWVEGLFEGDVSRKDVHEASLFFTELSDPLLDRNGGCGIFETRRLQRVLIGFVLSRAVGGERQSSYHQTNKPGHLVTISIMTPGREASATVPAWIGRPPRAASSPASFPIGGACDQSESFLVRSPRSKRGDQAELRVLALLEICRPGLRCLLIARFCCKSRLAGGVKNSKGHRWGLGVKAY
jgi:hypothetical protein